MQKVEARGRRRRQHRQHHLARDRGPVARLRRVQHRHADRSRRGRRARCGRQGARRPAAGHPGADRHRASTSTAARSSYYAVSSSALSAEELSWFVDNTISKNLLAVEGVAQVTRSGGVSREIRVELDPARMQALGITAAQVNQQLRTLNLDSPGGRVAGRRRRAGDPRARRSAHRARARRHADHAARAGASRASRTSRTSRTASARSARWRASTAGRPPSSSVFKAKGTSDVNGARRGRGRARQDQAAEPAGDDLAGLHHGRLHQGDLPLGHERAHRGLDPRGAGGVPVPARHARHADLRARHPAVGDPDLRASCSGWASRSTQISLLALSLVAGVLVDDAIVEIENIVRHMRMGKSGFQAALDAADEIGLAVVAMLRHHHRGVPAGELHGRHHRAVSSSSSA